MKTKNLGIMPSHIKFQWGPLHDIYFEIEIGIDTFKKYIKENEKLFVKLNDELTRAENKAMLISPDPNVASSYCHSEHGHEGTIISELIKRHRSSVFVSIFAFLESILNELCIKIRNKLKSTIPIRKSNNDLENYWVFLTSVKVIKEANEKRLEEYYEPIKEMKKLRNKVAHGDGIINIKDKKGEIIIKNKEIIEIAEKLKMNGLCLKELIKDTQFYFYISKTLFLTDLLEDIEIFFTELLMEVDKRISTENSK